MLSRSLVFAAVALVAAGPAFADAGKVIPLEFGPRPTTMVTIGNNPPVKMIFDTGAMGMALDANLAKSYGLPDQGRVLVGSPGGGTPKEGFRTVVPALTVGGASAQNVRLVAMEIPHVQDVSGVVSPAIFAGSLVRFEFGRSRAVVLPKDAGTLPQGAAYPYQGEDNVHVLPALPVSIDGKSVTAHLDSGSGYGLTLPLTLANTLKLKTPLVPREPVRLVGGPLKAYTAQLDGTVTVGPVTVTDPQVLVVDGLPFVNVGIDILRQLTVVLDPAEHRSWVLPADAN